MASIAARTPNGHTLRARQARAPILSQEEEQRQRGAKETREDHPRPIGLITIIFLVVVALVFDGLQGIVGLLVSFTVVLIPLGVGFNFFLMLLAQCIFFVWFLLLGRLMVRNMRGAVSRFVIFITEFIAEILPLMNVFPSITGGVISFVLITIAEDAVAQGKTLPFGLEKIAQGRAAKVIGASLTTLNDGTAGTRGALRGNLRGQGSPGARDRASREQNSASSQEARRKAQPSFRRNDILTTNSALSLENNEKEDGSTPRSEQPIENVDKRRVESELWRKYYEKTGRLPTQIYDPVLGTRTIPQEEWAAFAKEKGWSWYKPQAK